MIKKNKKAKPVKGWGIVKKDGKLLREIARSKSIAKSWLIDFGMSKVRVARVEIREI